MGRKPNPELDTNINVLHALMRRGEHLTQKQIAESIGCTEGMVYRMEKQAMQKLRRMISVDQCFNGD